VGIYCLCASLSVCAMIIAALGLGRRELSKLT
jgi:hypothetical protein